MNCPKCKGPWKLYGIGTNGYCVNECDLNVDEAANSHQGKRNCPGCQRLVDFCETHTKTGQGIDSVTVYNCTCQLTMK